MTRSRAEFDWIICHLDNISTLPAADPRREETESLLQRAVAIGRANPLLRCPCQGCGATISASTARLTCNACYR